MSRPLFILSLGKERADIDGVTFDPTKRALLYEMVEAVWRVRTTGEVTGAELSPIRKGFWIPEEAVWSRAGGWLAKLVDFAPELTKVVDELASHRNEEIRSRLCATLIDRHYPDNFVWPRLKRFINDRSELVRDVAVRVCIKRQGVKMVPALEAALDAEQDNGRRKRLQMAIALLKGEPYWLTDEE